MQPNQNQSVSVTAMASANTSAMTLFYRVIGAYVELPMFDDGLHGDGLAGDGIWGEAIPAQGSGTVVSYYVEAQTAAGARAYLPKTGELFAPEYRVDWLTSTSPLRINEFVAKNTSGIMDEASQFEDWVEIYNPTMSPIALDGYFLTDNLQNPTKWAFPTGTNVPANGTILVWCDEDSMDGPLHANFKLATAGEEIGLFEPNGLSLIDSFTFGPQLDNVSTARHSDGGPFWVTFNTPTPLATNSLVACGSRVYSVLNPLVHDMGISLTGTPSIGASVLFDLSGGLPSGAAFLFASSAAAYVDVAGGYPEKLLLSPVGLQWSILTLNGACAYNLNFAIPNDPALINQRLILQGASFNAALNDLHASGALEIRFCP
jgi:hypothetical protein